MGSGPLPEGFGVPVNDDMARTVVFIVADVHDEETGTVERKPVGTGFFVVVTNEQNDRQFHAYVVTAAHVVIPCTATWLRMRDVHGIVGEDMPISGWVTHDTADVAAAPIWFSPDDGVTFHPFLREMSIEQSKQRVRLGDTVYFMGLLDGVKEMAEACIPMVRSGTIGAIAQPGIPVRDDHITGHLIDCRSFAGFSGAPCIAQWERIELVQSTADNGMLEFGLWKTEESRLFGILIAHYDDLERQKDKTVLKINIGVGIVVPIERMWELMDGYDLVKQRHEALSKPNERVASLDSISDTPGGIDLTGDLMGSLLQVPKNEADEVHDSHLGGQ